MLVGHTQLYFEIILGGHSKEIIKHSSVQFKNFCKKINKVLKLTSVVSYLNYKQSFLIIHQTDFIPSQSHDLITHITVVLCVLLGTLVSRLSTFWYIGSLCPLSSGYQALLCASYWGSIVYTQLPTRLTLLSLHHWHLCSH